MPSLLVLLALAAAIAVHELGHLFCGLLLGLKARRITFGIGPTLLETRRLGTRLVLRALPLGANVELVGAEVTLPAAPEPEPTEAAEPLAPPRRRMAVLAAGPLGSFAFALTLLTALYLHGTHVPVQRTVGDVLPGSEAAFVHLRPGDEIVTADGAPVSAWSDLVERIEDHPGTPLKLEVRRGGGAPNTLVVTPRAGPDGEGRLGIRQRYVYRASPFGAALARAFDHEITLGTTALRLGWGLLAGDRAPLAPISRVRRATTSTRDGMDAFIRLLAALSVALGLVHLLPFPSLDGSRILLAGIELGSGRRLHPKAEILLHAAGFLVLALLVGWVAWHDLHHALAALRSP